MSKHEDELRRRLAVDGADIYDTFCWFLDATGLQAHMDGGPEPDLSEFEIEFFRPNTQLYHNERFKRMSPREWLAAMLTEDLIAPNQPRIDMSKWSDRQVLDHFLDFRLHPDPSYLIDAASALEELMNRANAKCMTVSDYMDGLVSAIAVSELPAERQIEDIYKVLRRVTDKLAERGFNPGAIAAVAWEVARELTEREAKGAKR
jgi:hypothetical protein